MQTDGNLSYEIIIMPLMPMSSRNTTAKRTSCLLLQCTYVPVWYYIPTSISLYNNVHTVYSYLCTVRDMDNLTFSAEFFGCAAQYLTDFSMVPSADGLHSIRTVKIRTCSVKWRKMTIEVGNAKSVCSYSRLNAEGHCKALIILSTNK